MGYVRKPPPFDEVCRALAREGLTPWDIKRLTPYQVKHLYLHPDQKRSSSSAQEKALLKAFMR